MASFNAGYGAMSADDELLPAFDPVGGPDPEAVAARQEAAFARARADELNRGPEAERRRAEAAHETALDQKARFVDANPLAYSPQERRAVADRRAKAEADAQQARYDAERREARDWDRGMAERKMGLEERRIGLAEKNAEFERGRAERNDEWTEARNRLERDQTEAKTRLLQAQIDDFNKKVAAKEAEEKAAKEKREMALATVTGGLVNAFETNGGEELTATGNDSLFKAINESLGRGENAKNRITSARIIRESYEGDVNKDGRIDNHAYIGLFRTEEGEDGMPHQKLDAIRTPQQIDAVSRNLRQDYGGRDGTLFADDPAAPAQSGTDLWRQGRLDATNRRIDVQERRNRAQSINDLLKDIRSQLKEETDPDVRAGLNKELTDLRQELTNLWREDDAPAPPPASNPSPKDAKGDPIEKGAVLEDTGSFNGNLAAAIRSFKTPKEQLDYIARIPDSRWPAGVPKPTKPGQLERMFRFLDGKGDNGHDGRGDEFDPTMR